MILPRVAGRLGVDGGFLVVAVVVGERLRFRVVCRGSHPCKQVPQSPKKERRERLKTHAFAKKTSSSCEQAHRCDGMGRSGVMWEKTRTGIAASSPPQCCCSCRAELCPSARRLILGQCSLGPHCLSSAAAYSISFLNALLRYLDDCCSSSGRDTRKRSTSCIPSIALRFNSSYPPPTYTQYTHSLLLFLLLCNPRSTSFTPHTPSEGSNSSNKKGSQ
jgi:hypothetical protein